MSAKLRNQLNVISELVMARPRFSLGNFGGEGMAKVVRFVRNALAAALSCFCGCFSGERYHRLPEEEDFEPHNRKSPSPILICDDKFLEEQEESWNLLPEDTDIRELGEEEYGNSHKKNPSPPMVVSDDESLGDQMEVHNRLREESDFRELKEEVKFLKACGVLSGTLAEIRKWSEKLEDKSVENGSERSLKFKSWLYNESTVKPKLEKPSDQSPTSVKLSEEWVTGASSLKDTNSSDSTRTSSSNSIKSGEMQDIITTNELCQIEAISDSPSGPFSLRSDSCSSDSATPVTQPDQIGYNPVKISEEWLTDFSSVKDTLSRISLKDTNSSVSTRTRFVNSTTSDEMQNTVTTNDVCHGESLSRTLSGALSLGSDSSSSHYAIPVTQPDQRGSNQKGDAQIYYTH